MAAIDPMSPLRSPAGLAKGGGVRRVNNLPLYIVIASIAVFLLIMVMVAVNRAAAQRRPAPAGNEKVGSSSAFAQEIAGVQQDGIIQPAAPAPPADPPPLAIDIARPPNLDVPPRPPPGSGVAAPVDEDAQRVHMLKLQQLEEAIKSRTTVRIAAARSAASAPTGGSASAAREETLARLAAARQQIDAQAPGNPTAAYRARLRQLQGAAAGAPAMDDFTAAGGAAGPAADYAQFEPPATGADRWQLDAQPVAPRSPYVLRAGFVLPAMLISGINSDLPGQIVAQVSQDVFDTATGRWKLIPQGARLVGQYASEVAYGQSRVLVAWQRIVFPDAKAMDIGAMPGADGAGQAGFHDRTNNRYLRLFGSALLMSGVTAGIAMSQRDAAAPYGSAPTVNSALSEALGQQLGQVTAQMIAKNMGIAPTLEIRPGYRFNVIVTKDMTFPRPYQAFDY